MTHGKKIIARFENKFVFHARYKLSSREQKVILHLVSKLDPKTQKDFHKQIIPIREIEAVTMQGERSGSIYKEMIPFYTKLTTRQIYFPTDIELNGEQMPGVINWFQYVTPRLNEHGEKCLEFWFSEPLKPALLQLHQYVQLPYDEIISMKSGHAIHLYQILKAKRDENRQYKKVTEVLIMVDELKELLGVGDSYKGKRGFGDFNRKVVLPAIKEINECSQIISVTCKQLREGRKVTRLVFSISDIVKTKSTPQFRNLSMADERTAAKKRKLSKELGEVLARLTFAQDKAYTMLVKFGMFEGTVLTELLPDLKKGDMEGFEDLFAESIIGHFKKKTGKTDPALLYNWWVKKGIYTEGATWAKLIEDLQAKKKALCKKDAEAFSNRLEAKNMTANEFRAWYKKQMK